MEGTEGERERKRGRREERVQRQDNATLLWFFPRIRGETTHVSSLPKPWDRMGERALRLQQASDSSELFPQEPRTARMWVSRLHAYKRETGFDLKGQVKRTSQ